MKSLSNLGVLVGWVVLSGCSSSSGGGGGSVSEGGSSQDAGATQQEGGPRNDGSPGGDGSSSEAATIACTSDTDCAVGETCDTSAGSCVAGSGGSGDAGVTCQQCACQTVVSAGGCEDTCKMGINGTTTPNFCDGVAALAECKACLASNCSAFNIDPTTPASCQ